MGLLQDLQQGDRAVPDGADGPIHAVLERHHRVKRKKHRYKVEGTPLNAAMTGLCKCSGSSKRMLHVLAAVSSDSLCSVSALWMSLRLTPAQEAVGLALVYMRRLIALSDA